MKPFDGAMGRQRKLQGEDVRVSYNGMGEIIMAHVQFRSFCRFKNPEENDVLRLTPLIQMKLLGGICSDVGALLGCYIYVH